MRAMLEAAGKRVHAYTSPNLVRVNERFRLGGMLVSDAELDKIKLDSEFQAREFSAIIEMASAASTMRTSRGRGLRVVVPPIVTSSHALFPRW